jgi:hypothetical protein
MTQKALFIVELFYNKQGFQSIEFIPTLFLLHLDQLQF